MPSTATTPSQKPPLRYWRLLRYSRASWPGTRLGLSTVSSTMPKSTSTYSRGTPPDPSRLLSATSRRQRILRLQAVGPGRLSFLEGVSYLPASRLQPPRHSPHHLH